MTFKELGYNFEFQFQNGAIKRQMVDALDKAFARFQFQNGAIKSKMLKI